MDNCLNLQESEADQAKTEELYENTLPSTSAAEQGQGSSDGNDKCTIEMPMVVSSSSNQEGDPPAQTTDDECDEDCDSFDSPDLLKFAWQIARGMVSIRKSMNYNMTHLLNRWWARTVVKTIWYRCQNVTAIFNKNNFICSILLFFCSLKQN